MVFDTLTVPVLTKFERSKVIGERAMQITNGAPLFLDPGSEINPIKIAEMEFKSGVLVCSIERTLPDGIVERFLLNDLASKFC